MIWIVLVLAVLCIAMSCVALWYRIQWDKSLNRECDLNEKYEEMRDSRDWHKSECSRLLLSIGSLNIELESAKERLKKTEFYQIQHEKDNDAITRAMGRAYDMGLRFDGNFNVLVDMLLNAYPKRDSKGRFCKK